MSHHVFVCFYFLRGKKLIVFYSNACLYPICVGFSESFVRWEKKESDLEESASR